MLNLLKLYLLFTVIINVHSYSLLDDEIRDNFKAQQMLKEMALTQKDPTKVLNEKYENQLRSESNVNFQNSYRLPNNTIPLHYNIRLSTEIHRADFTFAGIVRIDIRVLEASNTITLHAGQMLIQRIFLLNPDGSQIPSSVDYVYESNTEFLIIHLGDELATGQELTVEITYLGILGLFMDRGFFRSYYFDEERNEMFWLAATQFQPIFARRAFPCYDEIRYRTTIDLSIYHHRSYIATSNMPIAMDIIAGDYMTTIFRTTPVIPTFLLSFVVSNFGFVGNGNAVLPMHVFARPDAIAQGQAQNGLELGERMLREMENLFNIPFSFPKSDQIAMPEFSSDGANNWGLLSYREPILLQLTNDSFDQHIREIRIAHEYSHIFFANLVSPISWSYLWLNEGFATLYENVLNDIVFPEKRQWEQFLIDYLDYAMMVDIFELVPPLNEYVEAPQDVINKFDFNTYFKGAIVLRMFLETLTESTWTKGVSNYLNDMQFDSASPEDLYVGLQRAFDEDFPNDSLDVAAMMRPWFEIRGYPILIVSHSDQGVLLTQEGFLTFHRELFNIPINYATASNPNFDDTTADLWMTTRNVELSRENASKTWNQDDWVIFNLRDTGYYITGYDETMWRMITDALLIDHEVIPFLNRGTLFADLNRVISNGYNLSPVPMLDLMRYLSMEQNPHVWIRAEPGFFTMEIFKRGTIIHSMFLNFFQNVMAPVYRQTEITDRKAIDVINYWSCLSGVERCLEDSLNTLIDVMTVGATDFEFTFRCNGFMSANVTVWMHFYNEVLLQNEVERINDMFDLLCSQDRQLLGFLLNQIIDITSNLRFPERQVLLERFAGEHEVSYNMTIDFILTNYEEMNALGFNLVSIIRQLSIFTNTQEQAERIFDLVRFLPEDSVFDVEYFRGYMQRNFEFQERNFDRLLSWFENFQGR
ncbi:CLUMA_CG005399, isoform A [Clunio marinus]|uniref:Aminopeptidase n=1 Tax=Clunio marinus TaxID=568069 RepID=A0A1J1HUM0_9DIPT|nr:CLUMA_CG005399, isoform A [Clunio marinus]